MRSDLPGIVKLLAVFKCAGKIEGRKKLQKMVYLLQAKGFPFEENFGYHYYGPYAEELAGEICLLTNAGRISETGTNTFKGYPLYSYSYVEGENQDIGIDHSESFAKDVQTLNGMDSRKLELFATVSFLLSEGYSKESVLERLPQLKQEQGYSQDEIQEAFQFLDAWTRG